jgi:intein/homing endonuclease
LCDALKNRGCIPNKTYANCVTPEVPQELRHHFYRGLFDGDGSLMALPRAHSWRYELTGSPDVIIDHQHWLMENAGVGPTRLLHRTVTAAVRYTGGEQVERIMRLLYAKATVYLPRKFTRYQQLLDRHWTNRL